jgi:N-methylhydantoinase B/oxoprolinase/acetone carboxylase alpha subunit
VHWTIKNIGMQAITFSGQAGRLKHPARGLLGGLDGRPNHLFFNGRPEPRGWGRWELQPGDTFTRESAGGGGLHSPLRRDPLRVLEDVLEGYVSKREARQTYGVIIANGRVRGLTAARKGTRRNRCRRKGTHAKFGCCHRQLTSPSLVRGRGEMQSAGSKDVRGASVSAVLLREGAAS